jgi:hypothetical protein
VRLDTPTGTSIGSWAPATTGSWTTWQEASIELSGASGTHDLYLVAAGQIDWVLGTNPYDICLLRGAGRNNPPPYQGEKPEIDTLNGGISNGVTGSATDGSGIVWRGGQQDWEQWRWVEQWLPHSAWYIVAITALER